MRKKDILNKIKTEKEVTQKKSEPQAQQQDTKSLPDLQKPALVNPGESSAGLETSKQPKVVSQEVMKELVKNAIKTPEKAHQAPGVKTERLEGKPEQVEQKPQALTGQQAQQTPKPEKKQDKKWQPRPQPQPQDTLKGFVGKDVQLTLRTGSKLVGRLENVAQFDIVITASYKPVIVLKHAIDYVELP